MSEHGRKTKLQDLENALGKSKALHIKDGHVRIGPDSLDKTFPADILRPFYGEAGIEIADAQVQVKDSSPRKVVIKGKTSFPCLNESPRGPARPLLEGTTEVLATFELVGNGEMLGVTLRYGLQHLPRRWGFLQSFPELPIPFDYASHCYDYESQQSALDTTFQLADCCFYLTTHKQKLEDDRYKPGDDSYVLLKEGLNVVGRWTPGGTLGLIAHLASGQAFQGILQGQVIPSSTPALPILAEDQFPWDASPRIPGIHLEVPLGSGLSFPPESKAIQFTNLRLESYSPLSKYWLLDRPSYEPAMAYLGDIVIPAVRPTRLLTVSAKISLRRDDQLVFACQFVECSLGDLLKSLQVITGGADWYSSLPKPLKDVIDKLGPRSASIMLVRPTPKSSYEVACTQFTIGTVGKADSWSPFDLIEIRFESVRIAVVRPFQSEQRQVFATIVGTVEFLNVRLEAKIEAPSLHFSAKQIGTTTFDLKTYFVTKCKLSWPEFLPAKVDLADMTLEADPRAFYALSVTLDTAFEIDGNYSLPTVHLGISCTTEKGGPYWGWQFEASADRAKGVPVFLLIGQLADKLNIELPLPSAINGLTVDRVAVSYNSKREDLAFECWGTLPVNGVNLECGFTIQKSKEPAELRFGGQILLRPVGRDPISFSLQFAKGQDSKYCVAAYSDLYGYELSIQQLAACLSRETPATTPRRDSAPAPVSQGFASYIPESLRMTLRSALLGYYTRDPESGSATESKATSAVFFGIDLGAKVKLSDLPVVGSAMPKEQAIGFESLRIILASEELEQTAVDSFDRLLLKTGVKPLSDVSQKGDGKRGLQRGCNITSELLLGSLSRTVSLPVAGGIGESTGAPPGTALPPPGGTAAAAQAEGAIKWFDVDKSLGPVSVQRIGLGYAEGRVGIKFDATLQLSALTFTLEGLGMTYPLDKFTEPSKFLENVKFTLDGMGLALGNGPIEIGGSLVRVPRTDQQLELEGTLLIRTAPFTFSALGSYVDVNGTISVTAFAVLLMELGDPTGTGAFVVTGLAFGFGVNRKLKLPPIEEVEKFPLIQAAMGKQDFQNISKLPAKLRDYVSPAAGNFWIAAGIKFNSFVMVDSFLLVSISWGAEVEIGLLGLSRMTVPPLQQDPDKVIAGAELALRGVIRIADGLIQFEARLTENSFIFSKACRLTGGFAFCLWFAGPHAGDFVVSLGGYHPAFQRPGHYPLVPRLGMQLQIGRELSITGEAYFALTPSCIMAGGKLCAVFKSGGIEAWFIAYADFLMNWQPFYYQAAMGITLGIALRLGAIAIRLELSVDLRLQGPPFGGEALVRLWIISFTIPFGAPVSPPKPLTATEFIEKCLPAPKNPQKDKSPDVFSVRITSGLLREQKIDEHHTHRIVNAHQLSFAVQSVIPCTKFEGLAAKLKAAMPFGIRPMGKTNLESVFSVMADGIEPDKHVKVSEITGNVPDAVWGKSEKEGLVPLPKAPGSKTIEATLGIRIICIPQKPVHSLTAIPIKELVFERISKSVDWALQERPKYDQPEKTWTNYSAIWTDDSVRERRKEVLACLRQQLPHDLVLNEPNLEQLSKNSDYFQAPPEMNAVGY